MIKENESDGAQALGILLDDGTGIFVFNDVIRTVTVVEGDYVKIFGAIKQNKEGIY